MTGKKHEHIVKSIMPGSIAEELGIEPGDKLLSIDGQETENSGSLRLKKMQTSSLE